MNKSTLGFANPTPGTQIEIGSYEKEGEEFEIDKKLGKSLKAIDDMVYEIRITDDRVEYEEHWRKYIYSRDGKKPKHYYLDGTDALAQHIYSLGDNWYLITIHYL